MLLYVDAQFVSPYAMSAFVALRTKGVAFDLQVLDLVGGQQLSPMYSATSLTSRVPTLVDGTFSLSESSAIAEYLEETIAAPKFYPAERHARARARQVQAWLRSDLMALRHDRSTEVIFYRPTSAPLSAAAQVDVQKLIRVANALLAHGGANLFDSWCIADVDLALMLNRLVLNGDAIPRHLAEYATRQWQLPAIREWVGFQRPAI